MHDESVQDAMEKSAKAILNALRDAKKVTLEELGGNDIRRLLKEAEASILEGPPPPQLGCGIPGGCVYMLEKGKWLCPSCDVYEF